MGQARRQIETENAAPGSGRLYFADPASEAHWNVTVHDGPRTCILDPRLHIRNHSPTGYAWGYHGSGPAQLALALLCDVLGDAERAQNLYQRFKADVIAGLPPHEPWQLSGDFIRDWAALHEARQDHAR